MLDKSGIPNYEKYKGPLPENYFEGMKKVPNSSARKRVTPAVSTASYHGFNNSAQATQ